jgi:DNA polymerase (family X)
MTVHNKEIADILNQLADYMELNDEDEFRIRSYRNAARSVEGLSRNVHDMVKENKNLTSIPDIGKSTAEKIREIVKTGKLSRLKELKKKVPVKIEEFNQIEQLGPERLKTLYKELDIRDAGSLKKAAKEGEIQKIKGFGPKIQEKLLKETEEKDDSVPQRLLWVDAEDLISGFYDYLKNSKLTKKLEIAGSYRRRKETVGDVDILATSSKASKLMNHFTRFEEVKEILAKGETKSSVVLHSGLQVDLRVVSSGSFGAAMLYFTGSKPFNIKLRKIAVKKDWKINEYGIYRGKKKIAGKTEKEVFKKLELKYIEPELREDRGEIDTSRKNKLPDLVKLKDIKGDLQTHSKYSDGKYDIEDMVNAARDLGYSYYAVTDHSKRVTMANGLDKKRLKKQMEQIDLLNENIKGIRILKSIEVDILKDGKLDLPDDILKELDLVVCSIHYNRNLSSKEQTERVLKAMDNKYFNIFAHPTGRLINTRKPYDIDIEKVMKEARKKGCFLELNASPERLDLSDTNVKMAKEIGLKLSVSTDAHTIDQLKNMRHGIAQARRGWLEKDDVINTRPWSKLKKLLKR